MIDPPVALKEESAGLQSRRMPGPELRRSLFERHPRLTTLLLALVSAGATDVAVAHAYAAWARHPPARPAAPPFRIQSQIFHHGFGPLWNDTNRWGPRVYPFITNSLGFLDATPRMVSLTPEGHRIVFIGDSFTEGVGLPYAQGFVGLVEAALRPHGVSVLNASALSYSPIIYFCKLKYFLEDVGLRFDQVVVFLDLSDIQDELVYRFDARGNVVWDEARKAREDEANRRYGGEPLTDLDKAGGLEGVLARHTLAASFAYQWTKARIAWLTLANQTGRRRALWTLEPELYEAFGREGLERAREHMDQLHDLLASRGIRLTLAVYPWPDQILRDDRDSRQARFWRSWAAERNVEFIDYFPRFVVPGAGRAVVRRYFIPGDVHWNEAGHRLVAEVFLEGEASRHASAPQ